jgi:CDP-diacylglycerol pyrophosphatase
MTDAKQGAVTETIGALRSTPVLLVMVVLNFAFIAAAVAYLSHQQENVSKLVTQMFDRCLPGHP